MYKTILVKQMIDDGAKLLKELDDLKIDVCAAAWFDDPEKIVWKLVLVSSAASNPGPLEAYMQIQRAMNGLGLNIALDDIVVMSPNSRKFEDFRRTLEGVAKGAFLDPKGSSEGVAFDDAFVYRWPETDSISSPPGTPLPGPGDR
jgi:hypothetical protein